MVAPSTPWRLLARRALRLVTSLPLQTFAKLQVLVSGASAGRWGGGSVIQCVVHARSQVSRAQEHATRMGVAWIGPYRPRRDKWCKVMTFGWFWSRWDTMMEG